MRQQVLEEELQGSHDLANPFGQGVQVLSLLGVIDDAEKVGIVQLRVEDSFEKGTDVAIH